MDKAININTESLENLSHLGVIGTKEARALLCYRKEHGSLKSWEDLRSIPGFTDRIIEELQKKGATLGGIEEEGEQIH